MKYVIRVFYQSLGDVTNCINIIFDRQVKACPTPARIIAIKYFLATTASLLREADIPGPV